MKGKTFGSKHVNSGPKRETSRLTKVRSEAPQAAAYDLPGSGKSVQFIGEWKDSTVYGGVERQYSLLGNVKAVYTVYRGMERRYSLSGNGKTVELI